MSWQKWVMVGLLAASALTAVARIGKASKPMTPGAAVIYLVIMVGEIALVVTA